MSLSQLEKKDAVQVLKKWNTFLALKLLLSFYSSFLKIPCEIRTVCPSVGERKNPLQRAAFVPRDYSLRQGFQRQLLVCDTFWKCVTFRKHWVRTIKKPGSLEESPAGHQKLLKKNI